MIECVEDENNIYIVLEYVPHDLDSTLPSDGIGEQSAAPLIAGLVAGLCYCHANKIVHRDLKCANALLDETGTQAKPGTPGADGAAKDAADGAAKGAADGAATEAAPATDAPKKGGGK